MPYSKFTISKAVEDFNLTLVEGGRFLPEIPVITPTALLQVILKETLPWAIAVSSEKAGSEGIINPVLLEVCFNWNDLPQAVGRALESANRF